MNPDIWVTKRFNTAVHWVDHDEASGKFAVTVRDLKRDELSTDEIDFQAAYILDLLEDTDYPAFDVAPVVNIFRQWEHPIST